MAHLARADKTGDLDYVIVGSSSKLEQDDDDFNELGEQEDGAAAEQRLDPIEKTCW